MFTHDFPFQLLRPMCPYVVLYHSGGVCYKLLLLLPSATLPEYDIAQYTYCFHLWCKAIYVVVYHTGHR